MGTGGEGLPLGFAGSGLLLMVFTIIKSSISLLLVAARAGRQDGFPFLFETVLVFPFTMQAIFYTGQTCMALSFSRGLAAIRGAASQMGPCLFYAGFVTSTTLLETYSLQFILPSTFVVLKQLTMVVIAIGEVLLFSARPSRTSWLLIFLQACCVGLFQYSSSFPVAPRSSNLLTLSAQEASPGSKDGLGEAPTVIQAAADALRVLEAAATTSTFSPASIVDAGSLFGGASASATGIVACLTSVATGGFGSILQQRFMQKQAKAVPVSVKLFYQHIIELVLVVLLLYSRPEGRSRLWSHGFFGGWNQWTTIVSITMWFSFLSASAISAYISALAGAFAVAVSVALTGALEFALFGRAFSAEQFTLMAMVCTIAMLYTRERVATLSKDAVDEVDSIRMLSKQHLKLDRQQTPQECLSLCEFGLDDVPLYHTDAATSRASSKGPCGIPEGAAQTASARQCPVERSLSEL